MPKACPADAAIGKRAFARTYGGVKPSGRSANASERFAAMKELLEERIA